MAATTTSSRRSIPTPVFLASIEINGTVFSVNHHIGALDTPYVLIGRWSLRRGHLLYKGDKGLFQLSLLEEDPRDPLVRPPGVR